MCKKLSMSLAALLVVFGMFTSPVDAQKKRGGGGSTSCKGDKGVDVPIQVAVDVQSAGRIHASGYGGSDKSGVLYPTTWTLFDANGRQLDSFPKSLPVWTSSAMMKEVNIEGLTPGASYAVALSSQDWCGNIGVVKKTLTMPTPESEGNAPELSNPSTVQTGLMGYLFTQIFFSVTDDSGLQSVTVSIDGTVVSTLQYGSDASFRWWFDDYPFDNTQSTLEGPNYYVNVPDSFKGGLRNVEVVVVDMYGNRTVASAVLSL